MIRPLAPRGPDGEGRYVELPAVLGHRRLSIIDLGGGAQPMSTRTAVLRWCITAKFTITSNSARTEARGCRFRTSSDTEVLLWQFALDGPESVQQFNGMFAFAIWDREKQQLFLARDRLGIKPLYYTVSGGDLVFASEMKSMLAHPGRPRNRSALGQQVFHLQLYSRAAHHF